jgi:hypothetical protein
VHDQVEDVIAAHLVAAQVVVQAEAQLRHRSMHRRAGGRGHGVLQGELAPADVRVLHDVVEVVEHELGVQAARVEQRAQQRDRRGGGRVEAGGRRCGRAHDGAGIAA